MTHAERLLEHLRETHRQTDEQLAEVPANKLIVFHAHLHDTIEASKGKRPGRGQ